jgi:hypothetical protein
MYIQSSGRTWVQFIKRLSKWALSSGPDTLAAVPMMTKHSPCLMTPDPMEAPMVSMQPAITGIPDLNPVKRAVSAVTVPTT